MKYGLKSMNPMLLDIHVQKCQRCDRMEKRTAGLPSDQAGSWHPYGDSRTAEDGAPNSAVSQHLSSGVRDQRFQMASLQVQLSSRFSPQRRSTSATSSWSSAATPESILFSMLSIT